MEPGCPVSISLGRKILNLPLEPGDNELGAATVQEYMVLTLAEYFHEGVYFDGKYAFGGHWAKPIKWAMADADLIEGHWEYDAGERFSFEVADPEATRKLIHKAIMELGYAS